MLQAVNSFVWSTKTKAPTATPIEDCTAPLVERAAAVPVSGAREDRMMTALLGAAMAHVARKPTPAVATAVTFCREPGATSLNFGMYRPNGDAERFMLAIHDSGRAIVVGRDGLAGVIGANKKQPSYAVSFVQLHQTGTYQSYSTLPLPEQAVELIEKSPPLSVAGTWGKADNEITIDSE